MPKQENTTRRKFTLDKRYLVFGVFTIISLILWLMIKLSSEYPANLQYDLKINNSLTGGTYIDTLNNAIYIQVKASGFYIMSKQISKNQSIILDLKDKRITPAKNSPNLIKLPTINIKDKIAEVLGRDVEVISIEPDTLFLRYSVPVKKRVPVIPNLKIGFQSEYTQTAHITVLPDSIFIIGQQSALDTIHAVYTAHSEYINVNSNIEANLPLVNIDNVVFAHNKAKITIPVERCTELTLKLPIDILNAPDPSSILLMPPQVEIKYVIALKDYSPIIENNFQAAVDYQQTDSLIFDRKLKINLVKKPEQVISVQLSPEFVDFIKFKK